MIKLHLGCGWRNFGPDWIHIDGGDYSHIDFSDILNIPFEDNSVDLIYASHVFEYFDREEGLEVLKKWYSKLKPGGILRIAVPDFEAMVKLYVSGQYPLKKFLGPIFGKMPMGEQTIYHKTTYDKDGLSQILSDAGFSKIEKYDWKNTEHASFDDHSKAYVPHDPEAIKTGNFTEKHTLISLNMEAKK
jgi:predicted SAM-dependent methyltransferase